MRHGVDGRLQRDAAAMCLWVPRAGPSAESVEVQLQRRPRPACLALADFREDGHEGRGSGRGWGLLPVHQMQGQSHRRGAREGRGRGRGRGRRRGLPREVLQQVAEYEWLCQRDAQVSAGCRQHSQHFSEHVAAEEREILSRRYSKGAATNGDIQPGLVSYSDGVLAHESVQSAFVEHQVEGLVGVCCHGRHVTYMPLHVRSVRILLPHLVNHDLREVLPGITSMLLVTLVKGVFSINLPN
jgi:hypothetical protein